MSYHPGVHSAERRGGILIVSIGLALMLALWVLAAWMLFRVIW